MTAAAPIISRAARASTEAAGSRFAFRRGWYGAWLGVAAVPPSWAGSTAKQLAATDVSGWMMLMGGALLGLGAALIGMAWQRKRHRQEREHWRANLAMTGLALAEWQPRHGTAWFSPLWRQATGLAPTLSAHPCDWLQVAHPLDRMRVDEAIRRLLQRRPESPLIEELRLTLPNEPDRWYELRMQLHPAFAGWDTRVTATLEDISWRRTAQERQRQSVALFQHVHDGLLITDTRFQVLDTNPAYLATMRTDRDSVIGQLAPPLKALQQQDGLAAAQGGETDWTAQLRQTGAWHGSVQTERGDGSPCELQLSLASIEEAQGPPRFHVLTVRDISLQSQLRSQLEQVGRLDLLTGLPNRLDFKQQLTQAQQQSQSEGFLLCVCRMDLDHFASFNERWGAENGDRLLQSLARRLQRSLRSTLDWHDQIARLDGDEFALMLRCQDMQEVHLALERLQQVARQPLALPGQAEPVMVEVSLGATVYPVDCAPAETLLRHAAQALYRVKASGRQTWMLFDTNERQLTDARLRTQAEVQCALDRGELQLHYQPKVDMSSGLVRGAEALLRWQHPSRGLLAPALFLPAIQDTTLEQLVGEWVLEQAVSQSAIWQAQGHQLDISVNVSARQLQNPIFLHQLQQLLARHPAEVAQQLLLEVLESDILADLDATQHLLLRCKNLGVRVALDDFGTGFSNLTRLRRLPVDALKIDRSFVSSMLHNEADRTLVAGVIGLAQSFGCEVVAEGVQSEAHMQALLDMGCRLGQGAGLAHAMPANDFLNWKAQFESQPRQASLLATDPGPDAGTSLPRSFA